MRRALLLPLAFACMGAAATAREGQAQPLRATPDAGERAFQKCYACHTIDPAEAGAEGPTLYGIVGREVAGLPSYDYSPAMRAYAAGGKRWTRERLDAFIADPQAEIPGNAMGFFGIADSRERAALIAYLAARR